MTGSSTSDAPSQQTMHARRQLGSSDTVVVEPNTHVIPHFYGNPYTDNPLLFMETFQDAADENNWLWDEKKLARVRRALKGAAKDWYLHKMQHDPPVSFDKGPTSFIARFKKAYVTARSVAHYSMAYHQLRQQPGQSVQDYVNAKLSMARKYETALNATMSDDKKMSDILHGLRESYIYAVDIKQDHADSFIGSHGHHLAARNGDQRFPRRNPHDRSDDGTYNTAAYATIECHIQSATTDAAIHQTRHVTRSSTTCICFASTKCPHIVCKQWLRQTTTTQRQTAFRSKEADRYDGYKEGQH